MPERHQDVITLYTPASRLRQPRELLREMAGDLLASRELAWRLLLRNLAARYRQSVLGYAWVLAPPLVGTALFAFLRSNGVFTTQEPGVPYVPFLLAGLVLWQLFAEALLAPLRMVAGARDMIARVRFPREALVLAGVGEVLVSLAVRSAVLAVVLVWYGGIHAPGLLAAMGGAAGLLLMGTALGVALVPLSVLYQDVEQGLAVFLPLWMLLTPVLYPAPGGGAAAWLVAANPVAPVLDSARAWMFGLPAAHTEVLPLLAVLSATGLLAAWTLFHVAFPILAERMPG